MQTILHSEKAEVVIDPEIKFSIIGEKINPTGRKQLAEALAKRDYDYVCNLAIKQVAAGADLLDINVGAPGIDEIVILPELARLVSRTVDIPLCLDSANREALVAALEVLPGKPLINSVNGERASLERVLPVVKEYGAAVIGLTMDENGIPESAEQRLAVAGKILEQAARTGIPLEDIIIDPLVLTVGANSKAASVTLQTIELRAERIWRQYQSGSQQCILWHARTAYDQPVFPDTGDWVRSLLCDYRPDEADFDNPGYRPSARQGQSRAEISEQLESFTGRSTGSEIRAYMKLPQRR